MGFLNNRLAVTVDAYYKKTSDLLLNVSTPLYTGYTSAQQNIGSISNAGVELDITSHNFQRKNFTWDTKFNISFNKNKVLNLGRNGDIFITSAKPMGTVSYAKVKPSALSLVSNIGAFSRAQQTPAILLTSMLHRQVSWPMRSRVILCSTM